MSCPKPSRTRSPLSTNHRFRLQKLIIFLRSFTANHITVYSATPFPLSSCSASFLDRRSLPLSSPIRKNTIRLLAPRFRQPVHSLHSIHLHLHCNIVCTPPPPPPHLHIARTSSPPVTLLYKMYHHVHSSIRPMGPPTVSVLVPTSWHFFFFCSFSFFDFFYISALRL